MVSQPFIHSKKGRTVYFGFVPFLLWVDIPDFFLPKTIKLRKLDISPQLHGFNVQQAAKAKHTLISLVLPKKKPKGNKKMLIKHIGFLSQVSLGLENMYYYNRIDFRRVLFQHRLDSNLDFMIREPLETSYPSQGSNPTVICHLW